jgi:hypothetical protein
MLNVLVLECLVQNVFSVECVHFTHKFDFMDHISNHMILILGFTFMLNKYFKYHQSKTIYKGKIRECDSEL